MSIPDNGAVNVEDAEMEGVRQRLADALDTLPRLTRAAFMLHSVDRLSYEEVAWRCGMTIDEVTIRMGEALSGLRRYEDGAIGVMGRIRYAWVPRRIAWMQCRRERQDRRLGLIPRQRC